MKALVYSTYGGPEALRLQEVPTPVPKDDEVLIRVNAVSLNDWDYALLEGSSFMIRMMNGFRKPRKTILGSDISGMIAQAGKLVKNFKTGDEVFGDLSGDWGGLASYVCAKEGQVVRKPRTMTHEQAAAIPQAGMLAVQGLLDVGNIRSGDKVLINGAGGGVGTLGIQIAKTLDVEVTGVDSNGKLGMLKELGFDHVLDYTREDFTRSGKRYDLILDAKTNRSPFEYLRALNKKGRYVTVGGDIPRLLQCLLFRRWISLTARKDVRIVSLKPNKDLSYMIRLFQEGQMKPVIDGHYTLEETPEAFARFGRAEHKGKIVITVAE